MLRHLVGRRLVWNDLVGAPELNKGNAAQAICENFPVFIIRIVKQLTIFCEESASYCNVKPVRHHASRSRDCFQKAPCRDCIVRLISYALKNFRNVQVACKPAPPSLLVGSHEFYNWEVSQLAEVSSRR